MSRVRRLKLRTPLHLRFWRGIVLISIFLLALVIVGAGTLWFIGLPRFALREVYIAGSTKESQAILQSTVATYLAEPVLYVLPRQTIFTVNKNALEQRILAHFPRIRTVDVQIDKRNSLTLTLSDRVSSFLWQGFATSTDFYEVDSTGFIFARRREPPKPSMGIFSFIGGISSSNPKGTHVTSRERFSWILLVREELSKISTPVISCKPGEADDFIFTTKEGWQLLASARSDSKTISRSLSAAFTIIDNGDVVIRNKRSQLAYVDVRFPNRVYFRFRDELESDFVDVKNNNSQDEVL